jgi:hypothetical protein
MAVYFDDDIVDAAPADHVPIHDREYRVRAYRKSDGSLLLRGAIRDQKPAGLYIAGDQLPLIIHHMQVDVTVAFPALQIVGVDVGFEAHPERACPTITEHYDKLVGLSIGRGYTHRVRELFGGPRGCSHVTALLNSMGPVAVQCVWSMEIAGASERAHDVPLALDDEARETMRAAAWKFNLNSCHVWREDSELVQGLSAGAPKQVPIFLRRRLEELGRDPEEWNAVMRNR